MAHVRDLRNKKGRTTGNRWEVRWTDPNTKKERSKTFAKKPQAQNHLTTVENSKLTGSYVDPQLGRRTVAEQGDIWFASTTALAAGTRKPYESLLRVWVKPHLGDVALSDLTKFQVRSWVDQMIGTGLSSKRAKHARDVLSLILKSAVEDRRIIINPAEGVKIPKGSTTERHFLTAAEVEQLAQAIPAPYDTLIRFLAYSGLRAAEVVALRVNRVDLDKGQVRIIETTDEVKGGLVTKATTKNHEKRTIAIPAFLCRELEVMIDNDHLGLDDYLFRVEEGGQLRWGGWHKRYFTPAATAAGLHVITKRATKKHPNDRNESALVPHDLRHTCASLMIRSGATIKAVQRQLGHKSAVMTLDLYGHLYDDELGEIATRLDAVYKEATGLTLMSDHMESTG